MCASYENTDYPHIRSPRGLRWAEDIIVGLILGSRITTKTDLARYMPTVDSMSYSTKYSAVQRSFHPGGAPGSRRGPNIVPLPPAPPPPPPLPQISFASPVVSRSDKASRIQAFLQRSASRNPNLQLHISPRNYETHENDRNAPYQKEATNAPVEQNKSTSGSWSASNIVEKSKVIRQGSIRFVSNPTSKTQTDGYLSNSGRFDPSVKYTDEEVSAIMDEYELENGRLRKQIDAMNNVHDEEMNLAEAAITELDKRASTALQEKEHLLLEMGKKHSIIHESETKLKAENTALRATVKELHDSIKRVTLGSRDAVDAATAQCNGMAEEIKVLKRNFLLAKQYKLHKALERVSQESAKDKQRLQRIIAHMQAERNKLQELLTRAEEDRDYGVSNVRDLMESNREMAVELTELRRVGNHYDGSLSSGEPKRLYEHEGKEKENKMEQFYENDIHTDTLDMNEVCADDIRLASIISTPIDASMPTYKEGNRVMDAAGNKPSDILRSVLNSMTTETSLGNTPNEVLSPQQQRQQDKERSRNVMEEWEVDLVNDIRKAIENRRSLHGHTIEDSMKLFQSIGSINDGYLNFDLLRKGLHRLELGLSSSKISQFMDHLKIDQETGGQIFCVDFVKALHGHRKFPKSAQPPPPPPPVDTTARTEDDGVKPLLAKNLVGKKKVGWGKLRSSVKMMGILKPKRAPPPAPPTTP